MNIYVLPAMIAFLIKLGVFVVSRKGSRNSSMFLPMLLVFACLNIAEILCFFGYQESGGSLYVLKMYYVSFIWVFSVVLLYSHQISRINIPYLSIWVVLSATVLSVLTIFTDGVVAGSKPFSYALTAIRGDYYLSFSLFSGILMGIAIFLLVRGYRMAKDHLTQIQCTYTLLALLPIFVAGFGVLVLMYFRFNINGLIISPIATSLFLLITLKSELKHKLSDVRRYVPFSPERQTSNEILEIYSRYARDEITYRESVNEIEKLLVLHKYAKSEGNASETAQLMGMPRSSLYSIFNRLKIVTHDD